MDAKSDQSLTGFGHVRNAEGPNVRNPAGLSDIAAAYSTRLREAIGQLSVAEFGRRAGLSHSTLLNYLNGSLPGWENALAIARASGRSLEWFSGNEAIPAELLAAARALDSTGHFARDLQARYETGHQAERDQQFVLLPLYDVRASAGGGAWNDDERISKQLAFRRDWIAHALGVSPEHLALIYVDGDSMAPRLADGDVVMVDRAAREVRGDGTYVFTLDGALLVKHLQRLPGGRVRAVSENPVYQPFEFALEQLGAEGERADYVVGRVVWAGVRL